MYVAIWREFPDMTQLELDCAIAPPPEISWLQPEDVVARVRAMREARRERRDLSEDHWQRLIGRIWPHLNASQRLNPNEILAELDLTHPKPPRRGLPPADVANSAQARRKPGPELIVSREEVEECRAALIAAGKPHGYQAIARGLAVSAATVRRRLRGH